MNKTMLEEFLCEDQRDGNNYAITWDNYRGQ
jgi:hypothetical protein